MKAWRSLPALPVVLNSALQVDILLCCTVGALAALAALAASLAWADIEKAIATASIVMSFFMGSPSRRKRRHELKHATRAAVKLNNAPAPRAADTAVAAASENAA